MMTSDGLVDCAPSSNLHWNEEENRASDYCMFQLHNQEVNFGITQTYNTDVDGDYWLEPHWWRINGASKFKRTSWRHEEERRIVLRQSHRRSKNRLWGELTNTQMQSRAAQRRQQNDMTIRRLETLETTSLRESWRTAPRARSLLKCKQTLLMQIYRPLYVRHLCVGLLGVFDLSALSEEESRQCSSLNRRLSEVLPPFVAGTLLSRASGNFRKTVWPKNNRPCLFPHQYANSLFPPVDAPQMSALVALCCLSLLSTVGALCSVISFFIANTVATQFSSIVFQRKRV